MIVPGRVLPGLLCVLLVFGCAGSEIPESSEDARIRGGGTGTTWSADAGWLLAEKGKWGAAGSLRLEALKAFEAAAYADALEALMVLYNSSGTAEMRDLSYYLGESLYQLGRYEEAIEYLKKVYKADFPSPELIDKSRRRVFEIALAYLRGRKTRDVLWVFNVQSPEYGIDLLLDPAEGLITDNPYLSFADDAKVEVANYYFDQGQYAESVPLYDSILSMTDKEWKELASFQGALAEYFQVRGAVYDENKLLEARRRFRGYLQQYPRGEYVDQVRGKLSEINELEGEKNLNIARFYLREDELRACDIYLRLVLDRYPNTLAARDARELRRRLENTEETELR